MPVFNLDNYRVKKDKEEVEDYTGEVGSSGELDDRNNDLEKESSDESKDYVMEINEKDIEKGSASTFIAETLYKALERDDLSLLSIINDSENELLKKIKIVSTESIKEDCLKAVEKARQGSVVVVEGKYTNSYEERVFLNSIGEDRVFSSLESLLDSGWIEKEVESTDTKISTEFLNDILDWMFGSLNPTAETQAKSKSDASSTKNESREGIELESSLLEDSEGVVSIEEFKMPIFNSDTFDAIHKSVNSNDGGVHLSLVEEIKEKGIEGTTVQVVYENEDVVVYRHPAKKYRSMDCKDYYWCYCILQKHCNVVEGLRG